MTSPPFLPVTAGTEEERAVTSPQGTRSWREMNDSAARLANGWRALGLGDEDRVAIMMHNRLEFVEVILGCLRGGMFLVPINWHLTVSEVAYILDNSDARVLLCDLDTLEVAEAAAAVAGVERVVAVGRDYEAWRQAQPATAPASANSGGPMFYTSGTTGQPKGVFNRAFCVPVEEVWQLWNGRGRLWHYDRPGVHLAVCPLYHAGPLANLLFAVAAGQSMVIMPRFDAEDLLRLVAREGVTTSHLVPTQFARLLRLPEETRRRYDLSSLQAILHGAAPCAPWLKQAMIDWFGPVIVEYYGFSEATGTTIASSAEWLARPGTVGRVIAGSEMRVVDDDGQDVEPGDVGTLYFRRTGGDPPSYHKAPEKTAESQLPGGWLTVGDVGRVDDAGYVYLADRKADMIISGGSNIYPAEVEAALSAHAAVSDCAVFGIPDEEWGEQVKAVVTLWSGDPVAESELISWCRGRLAAFKCPKSIDVLADLPRDAAGKLKKRLLRDPYWEGRGRNI